MANNEPCRCGRIKVGSEVTEHRNWNPDCPEHGTESKWWNSPDQVRLRDERNTRLRLLQEQAREARRRARST